MSGHDIMYTSNPTYDYEFSWTIDNFSTMLTIVKGPRVSQISGFQEELHFQLHFVELPNEPPLKGYKYTLKVFLINEHFKQGDLSISSYTTIRNVADQIVFGSTTAISKLTKHIQLLEYSCDLATGKPQLSQIMNLLEDKLVVKGKLLFSGYDIASSVSSLTVKDGSEACRELSKDLLTMYESGLSSDMCSFSIGDKTLHAHKNILRSRSPVLTRMLENDLESNFNRIVIVDAEFHIFNRFLTFLYTGIVDDKEWDTVLSLYSLAHKYQVKSLLMACSGILGNALRIESVCKVLVLSDMYGDKELKSVAKVFILSHMQVVGTNEWAELVTTAPRLVKEVLASLASESAVKKRKRL